MVRTKPNSQLLLGPQECDGELCLQNFYPLGRILQTVTLEAPPAHKPGPLTTVKVLKDTVQTGVRHLQVSQPCVAFVFLQLSMGPLAGLSFDMEASVGSWQLVRVVEMQPNVCGIQMKRKQTSFHAGRNAAACGRLGSREHHLDRTTKMVLHGFCD